MDRPLLLYEADCGFCVRAAAWGRVARLRVRMRPLQSVDLASLGIPPERAAHELPLITPDGGIVYGHRAVAAALRTGSCPWRTVGSLMELPGLQSLARATYHWVSRHRRHLRRGPRTCR